MKTTHVKPTETYDLVSFLIREGNDALKKAEQFEEDDNAAEKAYYTGKLFAYEEMMGIILSSSEVVDGIRK